MGDLVDFNAWKKRKAEKEHEKEMDEIRSLKAELEKYIVEMGDVETNYYVHEEDQDSWLQRVLDMMITTRDGYGHWPIDSSDM
jgi:heme-degrading monooxygenase HmoA